MCGLFTCFCYVAASLAGRHVGVRLEHAWKPDARNFLPKIKHAKWPSRSETAISFGSLQLCGWLMNVNDDGRFDEQEERNKVIKGQVHLARSGKRIL
jgi:hypothetical protein